MSIGYRPACQSSDPAQVSTSLCCANRVRDSSRESSVVAGLYEQTNTPELQGQELARL